MRRGQPRPFVFADHIARGDFADERDPNGRLDRGAQGADDNVLSAERSQFERQIPSAPISAPPFAGADTYPLRHDDAPSSLPLSMFMVSDREYQEYQDFLLTGRTKDRNENGCCGTNCGADDAGRCCAGFSFVAMVFLIFVGTLIEKQPIYLKGVKQISGNPQRGRVLSSKGLKHENKYQSQRKMEEVQWRYRSSTQYVDGPGGFKMRDESSNAFKASAAYFLTMVLSLIYTQNYDRINSTTVSMIAKAPLYIYGVIKSAYLQYRRRHYMDIPETGNLPSTARAHEAQEAIPIEQRRTFELLRRKVMEMSVTITQVSPKRRRRDIKTKNV